LIGSEGTELGRGPAAIARKARRRFGLYTDVYEIRMVETYLRLGMLEPATFSLFARKNPRRPWLVAAGLALALEVLDEFGYTESDLEYLSAQGVSDRTLGWLECARVSGELWAVSDGSVVLAKEPLLELTAPLPIAQLLETALINAIHYDTLIATKAARLALAARGLPVVDFGFRRAPGLESGVRAALAGYIGGLAATSNLEAGRRYGLPLVGTMAHSFVQAFERETDAFREFAIDHREGTTLLVDTYDTGRGVERARDVIYELRVRGIEVGALRIDSGPLLDRAREARRVLDVAGLSEVKLFASGGLDEVEIAALLSAGAPFDGFGVGSALVSSSDLPVLDLSYKLVEYAGRGRAKYSDQKWTLPGRKQVFRRGSPENDLLERRDASSSGVSLLAPVWQNGMRLVNTDLERARQRCAADVALLPRAWCAPDGVEAAPEPQVGRELAALATEVRAEVY